MKRFVSILLAVVLVICSIPVTIFAADAVQITLDPERTVPIAPELSYTDSTDIEYIDGSVLHYVDFSTVSSLDEIGYYVGTNATNENTTLEITENGLHIKNTDQKVYITPFGAKVPKQIKNFTIEMKVQFLNSAGKYLVFNPAVNATGTAAGSGDIAIRANGGYDEWNNLWLHDKGQLMNGSTAEEADAVKAAIRNGEWVTVSISVRNQCVTGVKATAGDTTIFLQGNTAKSVLGSNWGFMVGNGNDEMNIKSVAMIAGYDLEADTLWPADYTDGQNVLDVPKSAYIDHSTIDLDPDRTIPSTPELSFTDSVETQYVDGSVLHYVDFTSVKSLYEVGYYVGSNATYDNTTLEMTDNGLHVVTSNQKVYVTPFGANVPKQIEDFIIQVKVQFLNSAGKYLVFNPAVNATGTAAVNGDLAIRANGGYDEWNGLWLHDKGQLMNGSTAEEADVVKAAIRNGEWVTISFAVRNLCVTGVKATAGDTTIFLQGNTAKALLGSNWGFMFGNGNDEMNIESVAMIAGYNLEADLLWPANYTEGQNILDVPATAFKSGSSGGEGGSTDPLPPAEDPNEDPNNPLQLRVASYNIRLGGMLYGYDMEGLAEDIRKSGADLIGLQEVDKNTNRNLNQDTMKILGELLGYYYYFYPVTTVDGGEYGDGILSKYPIVNVTEHLLDVDEAGGFLMANIDIFGRQVMFCNTHYYDPDVTGPLQAIYDLTKDEDPFIITGDFNTQAFDVFDAVFADCTIANHGTVTTNEGSMVDNMIFSPSVEMLDFAATNTNASDHYLITSNIVIPVQAESGDYTANLQAAAETANVGDTVSAAINVSSEVYENFASAEIRVSFDSEKLTFNEAASTLNGATVKVENGTLVLQDYGESQPLGTAYTLAFTATAKGSAAITLTDAAFSTQKNAEKNDLSVAALGTKLATVQISLMHSVTLPDIFEGATTVEDGADYTFKAKDPNLYDYTDVTANQEVIDNGDGTYTVKNVTSDLVITGSRTPKSFTVTIKETGKDDRTETATYKTDYSFTVPAEEGFVFTVTVQYANGDAVPFTRTDGVITIAGTDIISDITITVEKKSVDPTEAVVIVNGSGAGDVTYEATATPGTDYSFTVAMDEKYDYTVTAKNGDVELALVEGENGVFTISGNDIKAGDTITITVNKAAKLENVEVTDYLTINEAKMWLIRVKSDKLEGSTYTYQGEKMLWSEKYGAYCYLVISSDEMPIVTADDLAIINETATEIDYGMDVNMSEKVDANDAQLVYNMYNAHYTAFTDDVTMEKFLRADVNFDAKINVADAQAIINYLLG
ncbi:MAG: endonuclease/exonuclease/phosphatase family protein [Faecousia sp.]